MRRRREGCKLDRVVGSENTNLGMHGDQRAEAILIRESLPAIGGEYGLKYADSEFASALLLSNFARVEVGIAGVENPTVL